MQKIENLTRMGLRMLRLIVNWVFTERHLEIRRREVVDIAEKVMEARVRWRGNVTKGDDCH
jgi:hypothetical protein